MKIRYDWKESIKDGDLLWSFDKLMHTGLTDYQICIKLNKNLPIPSEQFYNFVWKYNEQFNIDHPLEAFIQCQIWMGVEVEIKKSANKK